MFCSNYKLSKLLFNLNLKAMNSSSNLRYYLKLKQFKFNVLGNFYSISFLIWESNTLKKKNYVCCIVGICYKMLNTIVICRIPLGSNTFFEFLFPLFSKTVLALAPSKKSNLIFKVKKLKLFNKKLNINSVFFDFVNFIQYKNNLKTFHKSKIFFYVN